MNRKFIAIIFFVTCIANASSALTIKDVSLTEFKGEEIKIEKTFASSKSVISLLKRNTYAQQDYSYYLSVFSREETFTPLNEIPKGIVGLLVGDISVDGKNNFLIPVAYKNIYIVYSYDSSKKSSSIIEKFEVNFEISSIQCRDEYCHLFALRDGRLIYFKKKIGQGFEPIANEISLKDKVLIAVRDSSVGENIKFLLEIKDDQKKYLGLYSLNKEFVLKEDAAFENYTNNKYVKILNNTKDDTSVLFEYMVEGSYLKSATIYSIDKDNQAKEKKYNLKSPVITVFDCNKQFGVVGYAEGKTDSLILKVSDTDKTQAVSLNGNTRKLIYDLQAYQNDGQVYLGMVYNEIRDYKSYMTFALKKLSSDKDLACN